MRLAFAITSLFPTGGLQRDCLAIARLLTVGGHEVTIVTADYRQPVELGDVKLDIWRSNGFTRLSRMRDFAVRLAAAHGTFDRIVGFNKIPGIDVYYCADPPFAEIRRQRLGIGRLWPSADVQMRNEGEVFGKASRTSLMMLAERQIEAYRSAWDTPAARFRVVPPTLVPARRKPELRRTGRAAIRTALGIAGDAPVWLAVASAPRTKGMDRTIAALARAPEALLLVAGIYPDSREARRIAGLAARNGIGGRVRLLGYREDMPELMAASDLLVHPARRETTGTAILESVANGLPAIVTGLCGYAPHVERAEAGIVLPEPFRQADLEAALDRARDPALRGRWSENGIAYGSDPGLSSGLAMAAEWITGPLWA